MNWNNIKQITQQLEEVYAEEDIDDLSLPDIEEMVKSLPDFEDYDNIPTKDQLNRIIDSWLELRDQI